MQVIKMRFLAPLLIFAFLMITVLNPVARANPISPGVHTLEWRLLPIASLFNYAVNLGIVVAAFLFVKRKINIASMKKLAIIVLSVTLVGMAIWTIFLACQNYLPFGPSSVKMFWSTVIFVGVVEVCMLAFLLRRGKLSTLRQGILIGIAMIIGGFFVGLPATFYML